MKSTSKVRNCQFKKNCEIITKRSVIEIWRWMINLSSIYFSMVIFRKFQVRWNMCMYTNLLLLKRTLRKFAWKFSKKNRSTRKKFWKWSQGVDAVCVQIFSLNCSNLENLSVVKNIHVSKIVAREEYFKSRYLLT